MASDENIAKEQATVPKQVVLSSPQEQSWIMQGINQINNRLDVLDNRLRKLEHKFWFAAGIFMIIAVLSKILLPDFDITITPKPKTYETPGVTSPSTPP